MSLKTNTPLSLAWFVSVCCAVSLLAACGEKQPTTPTTADTEAKAEIVQTTEAPAVPVEKNTKHEPLPAALQGVWQADDQSFEVQIQGNDWLETSEGSPMPPQTVDYQSTCASGEQNKPCLLVQGEFDAIYYNVLKLEPNSMVLQMIDSEMPPQTFTRVQ